MPQRTGIIILLFGVNVSIDAPRWRFESSYPLDHGSVRIEWDASPPSLKMFNNGFLSFSPFSSLARTRPRTLPTAAAVVVTTVIYPPATAIPIRRPTEKPPVRPSPPTAGCTRPSPAACTAHNTTRVSTRLRALHSGVVVNASNYLRVWLH